jgi:hypothetical protein
MVESKYIEFDMIGDTGKTEIWNIISKTSEFILGQIRWDGAWRQYCFYPSPRTVFNPSSMEDISKQIKELMAKRRGKDA